MFGWVIGVSMLWMSDRWTPIWKLIGTLTWPIGYAVVMFLDTFFQAPIALSLAADAVVTVALTAALVWNARPPRQAS